MGKSKSRNRKRNQTLRQKKNDREIAEQNIEVLGQSKMGIRLRKQIGKDVTFRNNNNSGKRKISDVVSQMIQPLLETARNFNEERNIVGLGVMAWNMGVIKTHKGEDEMKNSLKDFKMLLPKKTQELMMEFVEIKCNDYGEYDQIIYDYEFTRINDHQNNLFLAYKSVNE